MASAPIKVTTSLAHSMLKSIDNMFAERRGEAMTLPKNSLVIFQEIMVEPHHRELLNQLPDYYLNKRDQINVSYNSEVRELTSEVPVPMPTNADAKIHGIDDRWGTWRIQPSHADKYAPIVAMIEESKAKVKEIDDEIKRLRDAANKVLSAYEGTMLRKMLAAHPQMWELVPRNIQHEYSQPREPKQRTPAKVIEPVSVDLSDLTVALASHKLTGGV